MKSVFKKVLQRASAALNPTTDRKSKDGKYLRLFKKPKGSGTKVVLERPAAALEMSHGSSDGACRPLVPVPVFEHRSNDAEVLPPVVALEAAVFVSEAKSVEVTGFRNYGDDTSLFIPEDPVWLKDYLAKPLYSRTPLSEKILLGLGCIMAIAALLLFGIMLSLICFLGIGPAFLLIVFIPLFPSACSFYVCFLVKRRKDDNVLLNDALYDVWKNFHLL